MNIVIELRYATVVEMEPIVRRLSPVEYFDDLDEGEVYETAGIGRHDYAWRYLDQPVSEIAWTILRVVGIDRPFVDIFQNLGNDQWMNHRITPGGDEEIIHALRLPDGSDLTVRTGKQSAGNWVTHTATILTREEERVYDLEDGAYDKAQRIGLQVGQQLREIFAS